MGNTAARDAKRIRGAERAKRGAELRIQGKTWQAIADELGYADRSGARKAVDAYRQELPRAAVEELRDELLERSEHAYHGARAACDKLEGEERIDGEAKVARILKTHGELGGVIKAAVPVAVNVTQTTNTGWDYSKLTPEKLALAIALHAEATVDRAP